MISNIRDGKILEGAHKLAMAVEGTMGPEGRNVLLDKGYGVISASNDGFEISKVINLTNEYERKGAQLLKEAAICTHERAGDGCSAAIVIAHKIIMEAVKNIQAGAGHVQLGNGLKKALEWSLQYLNESAIIVSGQDELFHVACTAAKDKQLLSELKDIFAELNNGKLVLIEESAGDVISMETVSGMCIDNGYISPYFVRERDSYDVELENVFVLMTDKVITDFADLIPLIEMVVKKAASLLILSAGLEGGALSNLLLNVNKRKLKAVAVRAGGYGVSGRDILDDVAVYTGGNVMGNNEWDYVKSDFSFLGKAKKVKVKQNSTYIIGGNGDAKNVNEYIQTLEKYCREESDKSKRLALRNRMSGLSDERMVIKAGGRTNAECREAKSKLEKAFASSRSAYETGILPGGGVAFLKCIPVILKLAADLEEDERTGAMIMAKALEMPAYAILKNAGLPAEKLVEELKVQDNGLGYDVIEERFCHMYDSGIIDAAGILTEVLETSASVAFTCISANSVIIKKIEKSVDI